MPNFITGLLFSSLILPLSYYSALPTGKTAQTTSVIDAKSAINLVWKLPQVQRKVREIKSRTMGKARVTALVEGTPTPESPYYIVRVAENQANHLATIYWFRILVPSGKIQVLDIVRDEYIPVEKWNP